MTRRRIGDRSDGYRLRGQEPINRIIPFFMRKRAASINYLNDRVYIDATEDYIREKREAGLKGFGMMHIFIATYIRVASQRPALNRFVSGQRVFARKTVDIMFNIKRDMTLEAPESVIKTSFEFDATVIDVYEKVNSLIEEYRTNSDNSVDKLSEFLGYLPRFLLRFIVFMLKCLDYIGMLPKSLLETSPFHGSLYLTSMGSLGIPPVMHHLYEFGNVPLFLSFGSKMRLNKLNSDGSVSELRYIDICLSVDERICDGYYLASSLKQMKRIFRNPEVLDRPPETVIADPEISKHS